ncbi:hypothetical protein [Kitasatospora sp. NPDC004289]
MQLHLERGHRIRVVVTGYGEEPGTVTVARPVPASRVRLRLTTEQAAGLGLADGQEYEITGIATDANDEAITFPGQVGHTIPNGLRLMRVRLPALHTPSAPPPPAGPAAPATPPAPRAAGTQRCSGEPLELSGSADASRTFSQTCRC